MEYKTNIGLEIHIELLTKKKMFCSCKASFGEEENTNVCPVCLGLPGSLPIPNREAIKLATKLGLVTNCKISKQITFDRKNYFYKDLPKGYQITQFFNPICKGGYISIKNKKIYIKQIHMEEDAGKIGKLSTIDYNRAGIPLLEIVTEPNFENDDEVIEFLENLRETLIFCDISDCKMQEGSMRVDINISVRKEGEPLGNRTEIKNVGSFKSIRNAIDFEYKRQINLLEDGKPINIETRKFDEDANQTIFMRNKEKEQDYSYMREIDIIPINISSDYIDNIKENLPILPKEKREIYRKEYLLNTNEINAILYCKNVNRLFEDLAKNIENKKEIANLIAINLFKIANENNLDIENFNFNISYIENLLKLFLDNKISRDTYKNVFYEIIVNNTEPLGYIEKNNLYLTNDLTFIEPIILQVLKENTKSIEDLKKGKEKALQYLIGQCMKKLKGKCQINIIKELLLKKIN